MKKILMVGACLLALSACQTSNPRAGGALIGGVTGGLLGNTVGKGNGRTAATIGGAILGTLVGRELAGPANNNGYQPPQRTVVTVGKCDHISNDGARSSCERGVAERDRASQKQAEQSAYQCGRYGRCN